MVRAKTRARHALAVVTVGVTAAMGANLAAAGQATAAPQALPQPVATSYGTSYTTSSGVSYGTSQGWTLWSSSRVPPPPPSGTTALDDAMADLRARLDRMRETLGLGPQSTLSGLLSSLGTTLPPGVTLPGRPDLADLGIDTTSVTQPIQPPVPKAPKDPPPVTPDKPPAPPVDPASAARLELRRTADRAQAKPGDTVTHTVTVLNSGGAETKSAVVRNALPAGVKPVESKPSQGEFDTATGVWKTGRIKPGSAITLILVFKVPEGAAGSEMTARSSFVSAPGAKPVIGNPCGDAAEAACASTRVAESGTRE
ncbi:DUF11 domain-containing protein [Embleya sp. NBC_00888]|uniref:DUF11 domain-containing protein n=1 Tax=Embleya sp. NBC_00888 TaxID=2975960 RepID=UPI00386CA979|nr:DUF11 domain-containing protein [Embleya sp. NBC_00888]